MSTQNLDDSLNSSGNQDETSVINRDSDSSSDRNSLKNNRIARRAKSFKEEFMEKLSQIRTPTSTLNRSHSPKEKNTQTTSLSKSNYSYDINYHANQIKYCIKHFNDVVAKNKLEMLSGNVTILIEYINEIHAALKAHKLNETNKSLLISATQQVNQSLGNLIKLCDDALVSDNEENFIALNKENLKECIENLENGITNLVNQANEKVDSSNISTTPKTKKSTTAEHENEQQRSSLPDITNSKRDQCELENYGNSLSKTNSYEERLNLSPPPKPSRLPVDRSAPPLPPKKQRNFSFENIDDTDSTITVPSFHDEMDFRMNMCNNFKMSNTTTTMQKSNYEFRSNTTNGIDEISNRMADVEIRVDSSNVANSAYESNTTSTSSSVMSKSTMLHQVFSEENVFEASTMKIKENPPPIPVKMRNKKSEHHRSVYDNLDDSNRDSLDTKNSTTSSNSSLTSSLSARFEQQSTMKNKYKSCIESSSAFSFDKNFNEENPPPLPPKQKKHIMAYMEIFGNASQVSHQQNAGMMRHSVHSFAHTSRNVSQSVSTDFQSISSPKRPALPPKENRRTLASSLMSANTPPQSPKILNDHMMIDSCIQEDQEDCTTPTVGEFPTDDIDSMVVLRNKGKSIEDKKPLFNLLEEIEVNEHLVFKKEDDNGPFVLVGGKIDALIIHATGHKKSDTFGEAFLLTFRTFIEPQDLIEKLIFRYKFFHCQNHDAKQKAAKESFSLLVRVVNDLTFLDLSSQLTEKIVQFVHELLCAGELMMAKLLRAKLLEKILAQKQQSTLSSPCYLPSRPIISNPPLLIELKSSDIAVQMTILDAELFKKIDIPEILFWAEEQSEEKSPNLTHFTAHFNKLSYWARTQILKQNDARDREKYVLKFLKIMKNLRKMSNFNSLLALLSALESTPIRRLEWQKGVAEGLKEYCDLIDSSSSFRAYRQILGQTSPPCIPYIGLVLQDLTFVHIGNQNFLDEGLTINFSKRWQQSSLLLNLKRFKNSSYNFKRNEKIIGFFDNFDDYFDEDAMWNMSETIKPRGKKQTSK